MLKTTNHFMHCRNSFQPLMKRQSQNQNQRNNTTKLDNNNNNKAKRSPEFNTKAHRAMERREAAKETKKKKKNSNNNNNNNKEAYNNLKRELLELKGDAIKASNELCDLVMGIAQSLVNNEAFKMGKGVGVKGSSSSSSPVSTLTSSCSSGTKKRSSVREPPKKSKKKVENEVLDWSVIEKRMKDDRENWPCSEVSKHIFRIGAPRESYDLYSHGMVTLHTLVVTFDERDYVLIEDLDPKDYETFVTTCMYCRKARLKTGFYGIEMCEMRRRMDPEKRGSEEVQSEAKSVVKLLGRMVCTECVSKRPVVKRIAPEGPDTMVRVSTTFKEAMQKVNDLVMLKINELVDLRRPEKYEVERTNTCRMCDKPNYQEEEEESGGGRGGGGWIRSRKVRDEYGTLFHLKFYLCSEECFEAHKAVLKYNTEFCDSAALYEITSEMKHRVEMLEKIYDALLESTVSELVGNGGDSRCYLTPRDKKSSGERESEDLSTPKPNDKSIKRHSLCKHHICDHLRQLNETREEHGLASSDLLVMYHGFISASTISCKSDNEKKNEDSKSVYNATVVA